MRHLLVLLFAAPAAFADIVPDTGVPSRSVPATSVPNTSVTTRSGSTAPVYSNKEAKDTAAKEPPKLTPREIEELAEPIALYPDPLLSLILPAAVFPDQIVDAALMIKTKDDAPLISK